MHWGSPENLSDVTHPFLNFSLSSPGSLSEYCTTHGFLMVLASGVANRQDSVSFCHSKSGFTSYLCTSLIYTSNSVICCREANYNRCE